MSGGQALNPPHGVDLGCQLAVWCALSVDEMPDPLDVAPEGSVSGSLPRSPRASMCTSTRSNGADVLDIEADGAQATAHREHGQHANRLRKFEFLRAGESKPAAVVPLPRNMLLTEPYAQRPCRSPFHLQSTCRAAATVRLILDIGLITTSVSSARSTSSATAARD